MSHIKTFTNGLLKENPTLVLLLGMCPTLAVSTAALNGIGMGLATTFVLVMSNVVISLIKDFVPDKVRIPAYVVVIAAFVTIVDLVMAAYFQALHSQLGIFIPLIVVNCIVLGRAEAFACKNSVLSSLIDGFGMGFGFTLGLTVLGIIREFLGNGSFFGNKIIPGDNNILIFILAPGAFITLAYLIAVVNKLKNKFMS